MLDHEALNSDEIVMFERYLGSFIVVALLLALGVTSPSLAQARSTVQLSAAEISELTARTSGKIPELQESREIAVKFNARVAAYGGFSRELVDYVTEQVNKLGSVEAFRKSLSSVSKIHISEVHRMNSDLDVMIIPNEGSASLSPGRVMELRQLRREIDQRFPPNIFHSKMDTLIVSDFFAKYSPGKEHFEAISNLPITERGVELLPELEVTRDGKKVNLAQWGLEQYAKRSLDLEINPAGFKAADLHGNLKQVLRWVRYLSENPSMPVSAATKQQIHELLQGTLKAHRPEVIKLIQQEDRAGAHAKLMAALDKLQRYTKDSSNTRALIREFGLADLMKAAGAERRILNPVKEVSSEVVPAGAKRLGLGEDGKPIKVAHFTSYAAAQNINAGALWLSDETTIIEGQQMRNLIFDQPALYTTGLESAGTLMKRDTKVTFLLNPDAVEGIDFLKKGDVYGILTKRAIASAADGTPEIHRPTMATWRAELIASLANPETSSTDRETLTRALTGILRPVSDADDAKVLFQLLELNKGTALGRDVLQAAIRNTPSIVSSESAVTKKFNGILTKAMADWRAELVANVMDPAISSSTRETATKALSEILRPLSDAGDAKILFQLLEVNKRTELGLDVIRATVRNTPAVVGSESEVAKKFTDNLIQQLDDYQTARFVIKSVPLTDPIRRAMVRLIIENDQPPDRQRTSHFISALHDNLEPEELQPVLDDLRSPVEATRRRAVGLLKTMRPTDARTLNAIFDAFLRGDRSLHYLLEDLGSHPDIERRMGELLPNPKRRLDAILYFAKHPTQSDELRKQLKVFLADPLLEAEVWRALAAIPDVLSKEPDLLPLALNSLGKHRQADAASKIVAQYKGSDPRVLERERYFRHFGSEMFRDEFPDKFVLDAQEADVPAVKAVASAPSDSKGKPQTCASRFAAFARKALGKISGRTD